MVLSGSVALRAVNASHLDSIVCLQKLNGEPLRQEAYPAREIGICSAP